MKRWMSTTLPWFLSVSLHAGGLFALASAVAHARSQEVDLQRAAVWAGNTFEIETLSERSSEVEATSPAPSPAVDGREVAPEPREDERSKPEPESRETEPPEAVEAPEAASEEPKPVDTHPAEAQPSPDHPPVDEPAQPPSAPPAAASVAAEPAPSAAPEQMDTRAPEPVYGEAGKKPQPVSLAKALTRACPRAAFPDKAWHRLPVGAAGSIEFSVELDEEGKVVRATRRKDPSVPPPGHLLRLVARTTRMLKSGVFAMAAGRVGPGVQRFELSAQVEQQAGSDSVLAEPEDLKQIGRFVEPTPTRPGKADFTYNSGRHVILTLRMLGD